VIRDQPGYARPRLVVCFGGRPIRHGILVHGELFTPIARIILSGICHSLRISWRVPQKSAQKTIDLCQTKKSEAGSDAQGFAQTEALTQNGTIDIQRTPI